MPWTKRPLGKRFDRTFKQTETLSTTTPWDKGARLTDRHGPKHRSFGAWNLLRVADRQSAQPISPPLFPLFPSFPLVTFLGGFSLISILDQNQALSGVYLSQRISLSLNWSLSLERRRYSKVDLRLKNNFESYNTSRHGAPFYVGTVMVMPPTQNAPLLRPLSDYEDIKIGRKSRRGTKSRSDSQKRA